MTDRSERREHAAEELLVAWFPQVAGPVFEALLDLLVEARAEAGDLESFVILLTAILRTCRASAFAELRGDQLLCGEIGQLPTLWTNVRSIADSTGIPRETVRRKVNAMIDAGLLLRSGLLLTATPVSLQKRCSVVAKLLAFAAAAEKAVAKAEALQQSD
jgi:hypothetical protein